MHMEQVSTKILIVKSLEESHCLKAKKVWSVSIVEKHAMLGRIVDSWKRINEKERAKTRKKIKILQ